MSWRTQGQYRGLGDADITWLRDFDRQWDLKENGRARMDAMDRGCCLGLVDNAGADPTSRSHDELARRSLEADIIGAVHKIKSITAPKQFQRGWALFIVLKSRRPGSKPIRAWFKEKDAALDAYLAAIELMHWFQAG